MHTSVEQHSAPNQNHVHQQHRLGMYPRLLRGLMISSVFASIITLGHAYLFDLLATPRMLLHPWLLQQGFLQYTHIADEHAPLLPQLLAWLLPLWNGDALLNMQVAHASLVFTTVFGCMLWLYYTYGAWATIAAGAYFVAWSRFGGFWAMWYDLALSPLYLFIFVNIVAPVPTTWGKRAYLVLLIGMVGGTAFLIKQQAILVVVLSALWVVIQYASGHIPRNQFVRLIPLYIMGVSLPVIAYSGYLWYKAQTLGDIFYWMVAFNMTGNYSKLGFLLPSPPQMQQIVLACWILVPLCASIFYATRTMVHRDRYIRLWLIGFLAISAIMQYPRYSNMHWATALPFMALGAGIICADLFHAGEKILGSKVVLRSIYSAIVLLWLSSLVTIYLPRLSQIPPRQLAEYDQLLDLAGQLHGRIVAGERIVIFPDNEAVSNLYYLLGASPPRFWLMTYPWFMNELTLTRWVEALETEQPRIALLFDGHFDWTSNQEARAYVQAHYQTVETLMWKGFPVHIMERRSTVLP